MSRQPVRPEATIHVLVIDDSANYDVFTVIGVHNGILRARSPYRFEVGEEMRVRVEQDSDVYDAIARVRGHVGPAEDQITELELTEQSAVRRVVSG